MRNQIVELGYASVALVTMMLFGALILWVGFTVAGIVANLIVIAFRSLKHRMHLRSWARIPLRRARAKHLVVIR